MLLNKTCNKRFITQQAKIVISVRAHFADIYLQGMRDKSMRGGTELAREIQLTDWSTAGEQGKLVLLVSTTPSLVQYISLYTTEKIVFRSSKSHINSRFSL